MVVRANPDIILPELLPFFMHSDVFMHRAVDVSEGSLSPTIKWKILADQPFKMPPSEDQKSIADLLWSMDNVVEQYIETLNKLSVLYLVELKNLFLIKGESKKKTFINDTLVQFL